MPDPRDEFEKLWNQHYKSGYNLAYRLCGNKADAEDLMQDAFVNAYEHFSSYRRNTNFRAWLFRIISNLAIDDGRNKTRRKPINWPMPDLSTQEGRDWEEITPGDSPQPHKVVEQNEMNRILHDAIEQLRPRDQEIVRLYYFEGCTYREISDVMGIPAGSMKTTVDRIRGKLRRCLETDLFPDGNC